MNPANKPNIDLGTSEMATVKMSVEERLGAVDTSPTIARGQDGGDRSLPQILGGCRRLRVLGVGGMGEVHLAEHLRLQRKVALKILRPMPGADPGFSQRFLRESKAMAVVNHPNVVAIHDAGEQDGLLYMAIEYVDGGDLKKLIRTCGTLDEGTALGIMIACCRGLEAIHAAGLVHRDIKPANIFLDRERVPKIGDLGLARQADGEDRMTMTGMAWGTPAFMPPEQLRGMADLDIRGDIYALGATFYVALTGTEPFVGPTAFVITNRILTEVAPDVRLANRQVSAATAAIIRTCLEKNRDKRYPTPLELRLDLERARDHLPLVFASLGPAMPEEVAAPAVERLPGTRLPSPLPAVPGTPRIAAPPPRPLPASPGMGMDPKLLRLGVFAAMGTGVIALLWAIPSPGDGRAAAPRDSKVQALAPPAEKVSDPWMHREGQDRYGRWAEMDLSGSLLRMRFIPAGSFRMGSPASENGHTPQENEHEVTLTRAFWMCEREVSTVQYRSMTGTSGPTDEDGQRSMTAISWNDARDALSILSGRINAICRLPTEAQWEYACRAGSVGSYCGGARLPVGEVVGGGQLSAKAGPPNPFGLCDMHGNVREWCQDDWDGTSPYAGVASRDPLEVLGHLKIVRGGSFSTDVIHARCAQRMSLDPLERQGDVGFRFVIEDH